MSPPTDTKEEPGGRAGDAALATFRRAFAAEPAARARAPGRVNLIGDHVDYNDGLVLPAAVERAAHVAFRPRPDRRLRIVSADLDDRVDLDLASLRPGTMEGWSAYPAGVAWALAEAGHPVPGFDAALAGDIPIGAGLASSAAVEVAFVVAFRHAGGLELSNLELARLCQRAENEFVGVRCGIMDQLTSACATADHALLIDCRSLETRTLPLPLDARIVVLEAGVERRLAESGYNRRRSECEDALARLGRIDPTIRSYRDLRPRRLGSVLGQLPSPLAARVRHVVTEIDRVRKAADALSAGDLPRFGALMFESHASLRDDFEVSCPELDLLVETARSAPGAIGARLTGAGFGGCAVALVTADRADSFVRHVSAVYREIYGRRPIAFVTGSAAGASVTELR